MDVSQSRETRRRKILMNSQARLEKITGKKVEGKLHGDGSIVNCGRDHISSPTLHVVQKNVPNGHIPVSDLHDLTNMLPPRLFKTDTVKPRHYLLTINLHVMLLAVVYRAFEHFYFPLTLTVFVPLLIFELSDILILKTRTREDFTLLSNVLTLFAQVAPEKVHVVTRLLAIVKQVSVDFSFYFVAFVFADVLLRS